METRLFEKAAAGAAVEFELARKTALNNSPVRHTYPDLFASNEEDWPDLPLTVHVPLRSLGRVRPSGAGAGRLVRRPRVRAFRRR